MNREHLRAIIWPRQSAQFEHRTDRQGKPIYRYVIAGMIITDTPIPNIEGARDEGGVSEVVVSSDTFGALGNILQGMKHRKLKWPVGTAESFLMSMDDIIEDEKEDE